MGNGEEPDVVNPSLLACSDGQRRVVDSDNIHSVLLEWDSYTAGATPDIEGPSPNVCHRLLQMWRPLIEWSEVPLGMIVHLKVAVIALADFTEVVC